MYLANTQLNELKVKWVSVLWLCHAACGIIVPQAGIEPGPLQWEHRVLTTGLPEVPMSFYLDSFIQESVSYNF